MRIAIMGAGAGGGYFGGLLSLAGHDVSFIARGEHLRAMQQNGLTLETPKGALHVTNARFVSGPTEAASATPRRCRPCVLAKQTAASAHAPSGALGAPRAPDHLCVTHCGSNTAIDSTCEVCGNMLTTPALLST